MQVTLRVNGKKRRVVVANEIATLNDIWTG